MVTVGSVSGRTDRKDLMQGLQDRVATLEAQLRDACEQLKQAEIEDQNAILDASHLLDGKQDKDRVETSPALLAINSSNSANASQAQSLLPSFPHPSSSQPSPSAPHRPLTAAEYKRYGRQLIMPEIGLPGQVALKKSRVLIVGAGGLGCPAAVYLSGAGVGTLGIIDGDIVEESNLHRQILHSTKRIGWKKVDSVVEYLESLNPHVKYEKYTFHLTRTTAIEIFERYDLVLDCTDHPKSRYLISDACVLTRRPLVSASALKTEGQLIVLNNPPLSPGNLNGGPCYRCIFPIPPPPESITSCGEGGILGPVVGTMGVLQALEAIKVLTTSSSSITEETQEPVKPSLLMFSAYSFPPFRSVRMRSRRPNCVVCSSDATITAASLVDGTFDYSAFCGAVSPVSLLAEEDRIAVKEYARVAKDRDSILIDVRDQTQFNICALPDSINIPWTGSAVTWLKKAAESGLVDEGDQRSKYVICRLGNDSQIAAQALLQQGQSPSTIKDVKGGFAAWRREVDPDWPDY